MPASKSDLFLIRRLQAGEQSALIGLYDSYSAALYGVILRMTKDEALAQDLLQESFVKIWKNIQSYNPEKGKFYTWAYRIAKNTTLNSLRKSTPLIHSDDLSVYEGKKEELPTDYSALNGLLRDLEPHHQQAIDLVYFKGYTHQEAHQEMGVPLGTFKSYVRQAISKLREKRSLLSVIIIGILCALNG